MLKNPQLFLFCIVLTSAFFWIIPPKLIKLRCWLLILFSIVFLFSIAPYVVVGIILLTLLIIASSYVKEQTKKQPSFLCFLLILLIVVFSITRIYSKSSETLVTLGLTFSLLRAIALIFKVVKSNTHLNLTDTFLYMLFFPTYSTGPIERPNKLCVENFKNNASFNLNNFLIGVIRLVTGIFKITFIVGLIIPWINSLHDFAYTTNHLNQNLKVLLFSILKILLVYVNFSGISDIAIGTGRMFGIKIMENFNSPFLATNILEFWQRWHMSLGDWIKTHLYMPLIRNSGKIYLSIFIAFALVGLWHDYTMNYLVWGIGHGVALALTQWYKRNAKFNKNYNSKNKNSPFKLILNKSFALVSCILTIVYVSVLSTFANSPSFEDALTYFNNLITIHV